MGNTQQELGEPPRSERTAPANKPVGTQLRIPQEQGPLLVTEESVSAHDKGKENKTEWSGGQKKERGLVFG